ncbi:hypothetical protein B0I35DRAFT_23881 [Stachybotrys elegans]|uniref:Luciferase domain-containing protein n=1 Tax=Stachybotrys elegans TaxID=80388 RepID=A0A8K0T2H1_9HYPO|nr:hypothetical protein B0I35DRAFT_23881 [Stachybotrys elegans]
MLPTHADAGDGDAGSYQAAQVSGRLSKEIKQTLLISYLDAKAWMAIAAFLTLSARLLGLRAAVAAVLMGMFVLHVVNDYRNYLNLGPGGTPSTFGGYLTIALLHLVALRDPLTGPKNGQDPMPQEGLLLRRDPLPCRAGPRPRVVGIAPQRQIDQNGSEACFQALSRALRDLADANPDKLSVGRSFIEKHGLALFGRHPLQTRWQGEIAHIHDSDYAMHMALHPQDIEHILEKRWGQRHPLAWEWGSWKMPVSSRAVMIYASRDEHELQVVAKIVEAAIWYTTGQDVELSFYVNSTQPGGSS